MPCFINVYESKIPEKICYTASKEICDQLAQRFDFDQVIDLSGEFELNSEKDYFVLKGNYKSTMILNGETIAISEPIVLFLLTSQTQEAFFEITDDFEILDNNHSFDLEEILGQYLYLEMFERE